MVLVIAAASPRWQLEIAMIKDYEEQGSFSYTLEEYKYYGRRMFAGGCVTATIGLLIIVFVSLWVLGGILVE